LLNTRLITSLTFELDRCCSDGAGSDLAALHQ
jgi:hypothetical protein